MLAGRAESDLALEKERLALQSHCDSEKGRDGNGEKGIDRSRETVGWLGEGAHGAMRRESFTEQALQREQHHDSIEQAV